MNFQKEKLKDSAFLNRNSVGHFHDKNRKDLTFRISVFKVNKALHDSKYHKKSGFNVLDMN